MSPKIAQRTRAVFRLAPALLLAGAAVLGLGPWENAAGQAPILFSENPQGFNECIVNDGVFAIVGDEGDAQCTPRPPGWTPPPPPPPEVAPQPGGIQIDAPVVAPPPVRQRSTIVLNFDDGLRYDDPDTCAALGGKPEANRAICSEIDINDTFCIVGSPSALPCAGLFRHVGVCNGLYNRPALDPFHCAAKCPDEKFACGNRCRSGGIAPPARIPYVAGDYSGEVFRAASTLSFGKARLFMTLASPALTVAATGGAGGEAAVGIPAPVPAGSKHAAVLRAGFSCAGPEQNFGAARFAFTVTALAGIPVRTFEATLGEPGEQLGQVDSGTVRAQSFRQVGRPSHVAVSPAGLARVVATLQPLHSYPATVRIVSGEVLGNFLVTVKARKRCRLPDHLRPERNPAPALFHPQAGRDLLVAVNHAVLRPGDICDALSRGGNPNASELQRFEYANPFDLQQIRRLEGFSGDIITNNRGTFLQLEVPVLLQVFQRGNTGPLLQDMVEVLIDNGADPSVQVGYRGPRDQLIHYAARQIDAVVPALRALIDGGADPNIVSEQGYTPLMFGVRNNSGLAVFEEILRRTDNVNQRRGFVNGACAVAASHCTGERALHLVSAINSAAKTEMLIGAGADVNAAKNDGFTPVHTFVDHEHADGLRQLAMNGANMNLHNGDGLTPLHMAARQNNLEIARVVLSAPGILVNPRAQKLLINQKVLPGGIVIYTPIQPGYTPLDLAGISSTLTVLSPLEVFLISQGACAAQSSYGRPCP